MVCITDNGNRVQGKFIGEILRADETVEDFSLVCITDVQNGINGRFIVR
jgi:hypothetical protein